MDIDGPPSPAGDGPNPAPRWGVADDGSVCEVRIESGMDGLLDERWPPMGLRRADEPNGPVRRRITVVDTAEGPPAVEVDGVARQGGWDAVESELALFAAERLDGLVAIHAAVIVAGGRALLVPGASGAGKSSLCVVAAASGADVLSDEYALVDPKTGLVTGWPRPVRVRRPDGGVDRADLVVASDPVPVGVVALVTYASEAEAAWAPVEPSEAVLGLLANTVCAQSRPDESLDAALAIAKTATAVAGTRGEAEQALDELLALLA